MSTAPSFRAVCQLTGRKAAQMVDRVLNRQVPADPQVMSGVMAAGDHMRRDVSAPMGAAAAAAMFPQYTKTAAANPPGGSGRPDPATPTAGPGHQPPALHWDEQHTLNDRDWQLMQDPAALQMFTDIRDAIGKHQPVIHDGLIVCAECLTTPNGFRRAPSPLGQRRDQQPVAVKRPAPDVTRPGHGHRKERTVPTTTIAETGYEITEGVTSSGTPILRTNAAAAIEVDGKWQLFAYGIAFNAPPTSALIAESKGDAAEWLNYLAALHNAAGGLL